MKNALSALPCLATSHATESEWLEDRKSGIGASETASIFGVGYAGSSPVTVWASKTGNPEPISPALQRLFDRGHRMEPVISAEVSDETGFPIHDPGQFTIFRSENPEFAHMFATLDRVVEHPEFGLIPLELKNIMGRFWKEWEDDEPPLKYQIQCQHQMAVTGANHCMLAVLIGGSDLKMFIIVRDEEFIEIMRTRLNQFLELVRTRTMPEIDESEATGKAIARIFKVDDGETVELPPDADDWDEKLTAAKEAEKAAKADRTAIENKIKAALGSATYGEIPGGGRYSWKAQHRKGYTVEPSQSRVLRRLKK